MGGDEGNTDPKIEEMFGNITQLQKDHAQLDIARVRERNEVAQRPNEPVDKIIEEAAKDD